MMSTFTPSKLSTTWRAFGHRRLFAPQQQHHVHHRRTTMRSCTGGHQIVVGRAPHMYRNLIVHNTGIPNTNVACSRTTTRLRKFKSNIGITTMLRTVSSVSSSAAASSSSSLLEEHQFLLTRATAKQLKGDIAAAIQLTQEAVDQLLQIQDDEHAGSIDDATLRLEMCETRLFLGKLYHLDQRYEDAAATFQAARAGFAALVTATEETTTNDDDTTTQQDEVQTRYYTATTHVASAQQHLGQYDAAERLYQEAFAGHIAISGWSAGMTNHTGYELAKLYKQQQQYDKAINTIKNMQTQLAIVLGSKTDPKVLQLNSELANLMVLANTTTTTAAATTTTTTKSNHDEEKEDRTNRTTSSSASPSSSSTEKKKKTENKVLAAIALLEDAMEHLPPNSPETMRIFMQIENLKEQHELQQQQHQANGTSSSSSTQDTGVTITMTKGTKAPVVAYSPLSR